MVQAHTWPAGWPQRVAWVGGYAVPVFFVLSGYLLGGRALAARERGERLTLTWWWAFQVRRIARIWPLLLLVVLGCAAVELPEAMRRGLPWHLAGLTGPWCAVSGTHEGAGHLWSLGVEEWVYVALPLLLMVGGRTALDSSSVRARDAGGCGPRASEGTTGRGFLRVMLVCLWIGVVWDLVAPLLGGPAPERWRYTPFGAADAYAVGIGLAWVGRPPWISARLGTGIAVVVLVGWLAVGDHADAFLALLAGLAGACWIADPPAWLAWRPLVALGTWSYGVYLLHPIVAVWLRAAGVDVHPWAWPACVTLATVALAAATSRYVEVPAQRAILGVAPGATRGAEAAP